MKKLIYFSFLTLCFTSCEPLYRADIINKSNQDVFLEIRFDKSRLEELRGGPAYIPFLKSYPNYEGIHNISFDSLNLISLYKISFNSKFPLESGMGINPDFKLFKSIRIFYKDTIQLKDRQEITNAFHKTGKRTWELFLE